MMTNEELWQTVLSEVELTTSRANFITWFKNTSIAHNEHGIVTITVPSPFTKEWLENKYQKTIMRSLRAHSSEIRSIEYIVSVVAPQATPQTQHKESQTATPSEEQMEFQEFSIDKDTNLNPRYVFENFIVGSFNELAHAAARSVVKNIASLYNPLFIYGGVGLGKTHLLQAMGNAIYKEYPSFRVHYTTSEHFTNNLIAAIQNNEPQKFKDKYRRFDVLIIDDIQFIAGKNRTQEEFFHTFNTLYENNKQIIFSSDRPPKSIPDIDERLRSRFEAGLIADISQPDYETRLAILQTKNITRKPILPVKILEHIATSVEKNIRELEGALNAVSARARINGVIPSFDEAKEIIAQFTAKPKKIITALKIIKEVCAFYDLPERYLFERSRRREVVKPRQIAMFLLREDFRGSFPYIGQKFGGRDHTTAIHAYEKIVKDMKSDTKLADEISVLRDRIYED